MQVLEHEQGDQGGPELNLQGVGAGADEGLDAQVLLQRLEKEFNLPALAIDGGDGGGGKVGMVLRNTKVRCWAWSQTSMRRRNISRSALRQLVKEEDDLVALDETALEDRTALQDAVIGIVLDASDKVHAIGIERGEPGVVVVAVIENHNGSGLEAQGSGDAALVHTAFGNDGIAGQQTLMVEQQMQFHRAFGAPVLRPVKDRGAEFD